MRRSAGSARVSTVCIRVSSACRNGWLSQASLCSSRTLARERRSRASFLCLIAISTVKGSSALKRRPARRVTREARPSSACPERCSSLKPSHGSPASPHPISFMCCRRSSTSRRPPGWTVMRNASAIAAADRMRDAAPARAGPHPRSPSLIGNFSSRRASRDVRHAAPKAERFARARARRRPIHGDDTCSPNAPFRREIALAAPEIRDVSGGSKQRKRARPRRPAAAWHQLAGVARVSGSNVFEVLACAAGAPPEAAIHPPERIASSRLGSELLLECCPNRAMAVVRQRGRQAKEV